MVIHLGHGVAVPQPGHAVAVGRDHGVEGLGGVFGQPRRQRWANIEAEAGVVVVEAADAAVAAENAGPRVGGVTLFGDAAVPVVVGGSAGLALDVVEPGVLTG